MTCSTSSRPDCPIRRLPGRLYISRKTAAHHVSNILAKLGLRNRAQAVAYATRSGQSVDSGSGA